MFKKIAAWLVMSVVLMNPLLVHANSFDVGGAFSRLTGKGANMSVNSPGYYQAGARNVFVGGGVEIRVPNTSITPPNLITITPPRITAGCNGISAHMGGFSFISGEEFEMLLKSIASGVAMGFVSMISLNWLCPPCADVVKFLQGLAQKAAELAKNSCQIGQNLAKSLMSSWSGGSSGGSGSSEMQNVCGAEVASSGMFSDMLSGIGKGCKTVKDTLDKLSATDDKTCSDKGLTGQACADFKAAKQCERGEGNVTWRRLAFLDTGDIASPTPTEAGNNAYYRKLMYMNLLGVVLAPSSSGVQPSCETVDNTTKTVTVDASQAGTVMCPRTIVDGRQLMTMLMCGSGTAGVYSSNPEVQSYCSETMKSTGGDIAAETKVYTCADKEFCNTVKIDSFSSVFNNGQYTGLLEDTLTTLQKGVAAVRSNTAMPPEVIKLMQVAPYPLYQAINSAAVYPATASDLLNGLGTMVAEQTAISILNQGLRQNASGSSKPNCVTPEQAQQIFEQIGSIRAFQRERTTLIAQSLTAQNLLSEQIRQINTAIQREVLSADQLSNATLANGLNKAQAGGSSVLNGQ